MFASSAICLMHACLLFNNCVCVSEYEFLSSVCTLASVCMQLDFAWLCPQPSLQLWKGRICILNCGTSCHCCCSAVTHHHWNLHTQPLCQIRLATAVLGSTWQTFKVALQAQAGVGELEGAWLTQISFVSNLVH